MVIDSSAFSRLRGDVYRLLRRTKYGGSADRSACAGADPDRSAGSAGCTPRLHAKELGLSRATLDAGAEQAIALPVALKLGSAAEKISGYRLLVYPQKRRPWAPFSRPLTKSGLLDVGNGQAA